MDRKEEGGPAPSGERECEHKDMDEDVTTHTFHCLACGHVIRALLKVGPTAQPSKHISEMSNAEIIVFQGSEIRRLKREQQALQPLTWSREKRVEIAIELHGNWNQARGYERDEICWGDIDGESRDEFLKDADRILAILQPPTPPEGGSQ